MDSYTWTHQYLLTDKNLHSSVLCRHWVLSWDRFIGIDSMRVKKILSVGMLWWWWLVVRFECRLLLLFKLCFDQYISWPSSSIKYTSIREETFILVFLSFMLILHCDMKQIFSMNGYKRFCLWLIFEIEKMKSKYHSSPLTFLN